MAGTKYLTKQELIDAVKSFVFPNKKKLITGIGNQTALLDMVESLWHTPEGGGGVQDITYVDLLNLYETNTLEPGTLYKFTYENKYVVSDFGTGTGANGEEYNTDITNIIEVDVAFQCVDGTYTAPSETLMLLATSDSTFAPNAFSIEYPSDEIIYDITDNTTEEVGATVGNRTGFIHYRKDPENNVSADFDWRTAISWTSEVGEDDYERHLSENPIMGEWNKATAQPHHTHYGFTGQSHGGFNSFVYGQLRYFRMFGKLTNPNIAFNDRAKYETVHVSTGRSHTQYAGLDSKRCPNVMIIGQAVNNVIIGNGCSNILLGSNSMSDLEIDSLCGNIVCHGMSLKYDSIGTIIGKAFADSTVLESLNIETGVAEVVIHDCQSFQIERGTRRVNITGSIFDGNILAGCTDILCSHGSVSLYIGAYNHEILVTAGSVKTGTGCNRVNFINSGAAGIQTELGANNIDVDMINSSGTTLGNNNTEMKIIGCNGFNIGNNNDSVWTFEFNEGGTIGSGNYMLELYTGSSADSVTIGDSNSNIRVEGSSIVIGSHNNNIYAVDPIFGLSLGDTCSDIIIYACSDITVGSDVDDVFITATNSFSIGDNSSFVTIQSASNASVGSNCTNVCLGAGPLLIKPAFTLPDTIRGLIDGNSAYPETFQGTQYASLRHLLGLTSESIIGNISGTGNSVSTSVGDNCEDIFIVGGSDNTVGDNVRRLRMGPINNTSFDSTVQLTGSIVGTAYRLAFDPYKAGAPEVGFIEVELDIASPPFSQNPLGVPADLGISGVRTGMWSVIDDGCRDVDLLNFCQVLLINASTVSIDTINEVIVNVPNVTIAAGATGNQNVVIEATSPDNKPWYKTIDNAGIVTWVAYV